MNRNKQFGDGAILRQALIAPHLRPNSACTLPAIPPDPVQWARDALGFHPDPLQARVLASQANFGLLCCTRQWGKSTIIAIKALHTALIQPEALVLIVAPASRQSGEFLYKIHQFVRRLGLVPRGCRHHSISLALPNGSRIIGLPSVEANVRGFSAVNLLLFDEAARVPDVMPDALAPVLAVSGGATWYMSTPFGRRGFFYREWNNSKSEFEKISVSADKCPRIPKKFLEQERQNRPDFWFRQEFLCEFVETNKPFIEMASILAAVDPTITPLFPKGTF